jgi:FAD/FMN-containing dehydrogenase
MIGENGVHRQNIDIGERTLFDRLQMVVGDSGLLVGEAAAAFGTGWSRLGTPIMLARPRSTAEVAEIVRLCGSANVPMVPWGGRTGLVSGCMADGAVAISMDRMNRVEAISAVDGTMVVEAGCVVQAAAEAAEAQGMFLPLDLGARGSATIGGVISTNAGGNRVLRFGMTRDMILGLEAVLADGTVLSSMKPLMKNNTGYDLKQLFIGSEGTLGIVTRAVIRLRGAYPTHNAALLALDDFGDVAALLRRLESRLGGQLSAFEAMWPEYYERVTTPPAPNRPIVPHGHAFYVLVEAMGGDVEDDHARFEAALAEVLECGMVADAVVAQSQADIAAMWDLRDGGDMARHLGPYIAPDISLRLSDIAPFAAKLRDRLAERWPGVKPILLGHVGDGNIHVIVTLGEDGAARRDQVTCTVLELVGEFDGSVSAEHGIGLDKRAYLPLSRSTAELSTMRLLKHALDPHNLLNPGKLLPAED